MNLQDVPQKKRLTYGRLVLIMLGLIALAIGLAYWRQSTLGPQPTFEGIPFYRLEQAEYNRTQLRSDELDQLERYTSQIQGAVLFVRTDEGNYAKLAANFNFCLIDPQNRKFWIYRGTVYDPDGAVIRRLDNACVALSERYDLDSGQAESQGAPEGSGDLFFRQEGAAVFYVRALSGAFLAAPDRKQLRPE